MKHENESQPLQKARDEVCQNVGRNLLRFQALERGLKEIAAKSHTQFFIEGANPRVKDLSPKVEKQTLGGVSSFFFEKVVNDLSFRSDNELETDLHNCEMKIRFKLDTQTREEWIQRLKSLTDERNELVHHSLSLFELHTVKGCLRTVEQLKEQRVRIESEIRLLVSISQAINDSKSKFREWLEDESIWRAFDHYTNS